VDDKERRRNDVVYSYQGNRNPFVDHPEWARCVFLGECSGGGDGELENGVPVSDLSAARYEELEFFMNVPADATNLVFQISGGSGDADLYVKFGSAPTTSSYDCRPYKSGNEEQCSFASPSTGTYYVMIRAYSAFSGVTLVGSFDGPQANNPPEANFGFSTSDLTASFSDASTDSDGSVVAWAWTFGDGATSSTRNPSHTYGSAGTYSVRLTVTDDDGATDSHQANVTVTATANQAPSANFSYSAADLTVSFSDASSDPDGSVVAWAWTFGDGSSSSTRNPGHTYASGGTYSVRLTVTDDDGATSSHQLSITVTEPSSGPTALVNGVPVSNISGAQYDEVEFLMEVPADSTDLLFAMSGGSGDGDLYVKLGSPPTTSSYDCRPYKSGNTESCSFSSPSAGTWYVMIRGYSAFSGVTLEGSYAIGGGGGGGGDAPCTDCDHHDGSLTGDGDADVQPGGTYYYASTGSHEGWLEGPAGTDFDLYLYKWGGSSWSRVASGTSSSSSEHISYSGASGYYYWSVKSYSGSGSYDLWLDTP
jgi:PKD repeat protein